MVHVLVQNIPIGMLRNGCSSALSALATHLAKGRGEVDSFYYQKVKVEGEDICTGNIVIILSNWNNPNINPLPRYENVGGLTLRYKHRGQPEYRPTSEQVEKPNDTKISSVPTPENEHASTKEVEADFPVIPKPEETASENFETNDSRPSFTRKRQSGRWEKKNPKKSIQRNSPQPATNDNDIDFKIVDESKITNIEKQNSAAEPYVEEDADLSFDEEDFTTSRCLEETQ